MMSRVRFIADNGTVVLVSEKESSDGSTQISPLRIEAQIMHPPTNADVETWGTIGLLDAEELAQVTARCLNAALSIDSADIATATQALEILVAQQLAKVDADDPVSLMEEAMRYILRQERWKFGISRKRRPDGTRLALENPNGPEVPLGVHVSTRGKTPSFWVMQNNRLIQGGHAYKIPIQAATTLKAAVDDYINQNDVGLIRPHG